MEDTKIIDVTKHARKGWFFELGLSAQLVGGVADPRPTDQWVVKYSHVGEWEQLGAQRGTATRRQMATKAADE